LTSRLLKFRLLAAVPFRHVEQAELDVEGG